MYSKIRVLGNLFFDYVIITLLLTISFVLVIPFIPVYIGVNEYFLEHYEDRKLKNIFTSIKANFSIIIKFTIFELIALIFAIGNIIFFNTGERSNDLITLLSYVILIFSLVCFINAPIIIIKMKVTLKQLLFNCFALIFGKWYLSILLIVLAGGVIIGCCYLPYITPFVLYFIALLGSTINLRLLNILKAKSMKLSVEEIDKKESEDTYYEKLENREEE